MKNNSDYNFFKEHGFVVLKRIYTKKECREILKALLECSDLNFSQMLNVHKKEFLISQVSKKINTADSMVIRSDLVKRYFYLSELFLNVFKKKLFTKKIDNLYRKECVGLQTQVIFKKPKTKFGKQVYLPHQDNSYAKNKNGLFFTSHLLLENANIQNGTIYVYDKSHTIGLKKFIPTKSYGNSKKAGNEIDVKAIEEKYKKIAIKGHVGDILVMHGNLIHGSYENMTHNKSRTTFCLCAIPKSEKFIKGNNARREVFRLR
jgi:ectoine hydroxylase-related dioxygenase (phytanoyl-CoA dioxygenase family)|tara:strand:+ start:8614 stop:9396 length:783 start_codon:yes stop_codon:yes gene_type:complete